MYDDLCRDGVPAVEALGDAAVKQWLRNSMAGSVALDATAISTRRSVG